MTDITRLVLTRKAYQSINIAGMVTVTVEEIRGKTVRISVEAPRGIAVHRQEIFERIHGGGPDDDGGAGVCVPAGPVSGPDRPPDRSGVPVGGGATPRLHPGDGWQEPL